MAVLHQATPPLSAVVQEPYSSPLYEKGNTQRCGHVDSVQYTVQRHVDSVQYRDVYPALATWPVSRVRHSAPGSAAGRRHTRSAASSSTAVAAAVTAAAARVRLVARGQQGS